jgi:RHS repeat-associated protein
MIWRVITFWLLGASFAVADFPRHSHVFAYNNGMAAGPGILTQMGDANPNLGDWTGGVSPFSRVNTETNTCTGYSAYGEVNGESTLEAWLDGQPLSVTTNSSYDPLYPIRWAAQMQLTPGAHQLKVAALHPSGFYTAWATNSFTNNVAHETTAIYRDYNGNIEQRIWTDTNGAQLHLQDLAWDTKNRLTDVTDVDGSYNGFYWHAEYDGLDRRLLTEYWVMTNGVAQIAGVTPFTINQYYDPQVEFLELGVSYDNQTTWKLYGPDLDGQYGGLNGTGGLDGVSPYLSLFNPVISDVRGNILAEVTNGVVVWNTSRPTGYGAQPGFQPVALGHGADVAQSSAWRGRWLDITGYYNIGLRPYNPVAGNWLSYDSTWNERDPNYLTFSGDDPINFFDPDGRCANPVSTTGVVGAAGVLEQAAQVRYNYRADVQSLIDTGTYSAERDALREFYNQPENTTALASAIADFYTSQQSAAGVVRNLTTPTVTAASVNNAAAFARYGGQGLIVLGAGISVYNVATAPDPYLAMAQEGSATVVGVGGASVGAWAGAGIGAAAGSVVPVVGTAAGGVIGAIVGAIGGGFGGGVAGHALGGQAYNSLYGH